MPIRGYQNEELVGVDEIISRLNSGLRQSATTFATEYQSEMLEAQRKIDEAEKKAQKDLIERMAELRTKGLLANEAEVIKYGENVRAKARLDSLNQEVEIYKSISLTQRKETEAKIKALEREREIVEAQDKLLEAEAAGRAADVKEQKEKLKNLKQAARDEERRRKAQQEADEYQFGQSIRQKFTAFENAIDQPGTHVKQTLEEDLQKTMKGLADKIGQLGNAINGAISTYASYQTRINARLQEVSSFSEATKRLNSVAFSPLLNAEELYSNLSALVNQGIVTNVEQRAFFETVKGGIADTFDVNNAALLRMIRLQQNDSTAARLGLEAYLNRFLNVYVENTEYLTTTFDSVASSLFEASALLGQANNTKASLEFEYVVQKWLGTLTGLGLSDAAATSIADAIGQLGSGEVDNRMQNLLVMAAGRANLSYGEMLYGGVNAQETNLLLKSIVEYLQELSGYEGNIVKSQLGKVFGISVSDLVAVNNLSADTLKSVQDDILTYDQMYGELYNQFQQLPGRVGISNILENVFKNFTFQTGMDIASNPALFATWKITDLIQSVTGGINIPFITAMGSGLDLNASLENLIKLGIVGISTIGNIGNIISGASSAFNGATLLDKVGISQSGAEIKRLSEGPLTKTNGKRKSGTSTSESAFVGNTSGAAYQESALNEAKAGPEEELRQKEEEYVDPVVDYLDKEVHLVQHFDDFKFSIDTMTSAIGASTAATQEIKALLDENGALYAQIVAISKNMLSTASTSKANNTESGKIQAAIEKLRQQQLAIYQSQMLGNFYEEGNINTTAGTYSKFVSNFRSRSNVGTSITSKGLTPILSSVNPANEKDYGSLSDYLEQLEFGNKFTEIHDDIKHIADKFLGPTAATSSPTDDISGFTNFKF